MAKVKTIFDYFKDAFKSGLVKTQKFNRQADKKIGYTEIFVYVKDMTRWEALEVFKKFLKKEGIKFEQIKDKRSSGIETLKVPDYKAFILFKAVKVKGQGGRDFEAEMKTDLERYLNGEHQTIKHKDAINEIKKTLKLKEDARFKVEHPGPQNKKRPMSFDGNKITVSNCTGETVADLILVPPKGSRSSNVYMSLKMSDTYFIINGAVKPFFMSKNLRKPAYEYFGLDGGVNGMAGHGKVWACETDQPDYSRVKKNLENLVSVSCGTNVVIVYKRNNNDVFVSVAGKTPPKVVLDRITDRSYSYCQAGVRKYTVIKVEGTVEGHRFSIFFQFRDGTKGGGSDPKYLRLLMKKAGTSLPDK